MEIDLRRRRFLNTTVRGPAAFVVGSALKPLEQWAPPINTAVKYDRLVVAPENINEEMIDDYQNKGGFIYFGGVMTRAFQDEKGYSYLVTETGIFQRKVDGNTELWNTSRQMKLLGFDRKLENGSLGVKVPREGDYKRTFFDEPEKVVPFTHLPINARLVDYTQQLQADQVNLGEIRGFADYNGVFNVYRYDTMILQQIIETGEVNQILMGHAFLKTGRIPDNLIFPEPQIYTPKKRLPHGCRLSGYVQEGRASYYSHAGCLGCSAGQIMANGEPFRENNLTIAQQRLPLGSLAIVENIDTGDSVIVRVTDRGGFEAYGLIADLSQGTKNAIRGGSHTRVRISGLYC